MTIEPTIEGELTFAHAIGHDWGCGMGLNLGDIDSTSIVSIKNEDGHLERFAATTDFLVAHQWEDQGAGSNHFSDWQYLGSNRFGTSVQVTRNADGRLEVFSVDDGDTCWHIWQTAPNNGWSAWTKIDGTVLLAIDSIALNADGRVEIFGMGGNADRVVHSYQGGHGTGAWAKFGPLNNDGKAIAAVKSAALEGDGFLRVQARDAGGNFVSSKQTGNGWTNWG